MKTSAQCLPEVRGKEVLFKDLEIWSPEFFQKSKIYLDTRGMVCELQGKTNQGQRGSM